MRYWKAAYWPLEIDGRATFRKRFRLNFDCTGYDVLAQIYNISKTSKLADFEVEWNDLATGDFWLVLPHTITATLPENAEWDLLVIDLATPDDERGYLLKGPVTVDLRCTQEVAP